MSDSKEYTHCVYRELASAEITDRQTTMTDLLQRPLIQQIGIFVIAAK
jgi:hypothetical protein